jgi:hypothetical protein
MYVQLTVLNAARKHLHTSDLSGKVGNSFFPLSVEYNDNSFIFCLKQWYNRLDILGRLYEETKSHSKTKTVVSPTVLNYTIIIISITILHCILVIDDVL